MTIAGALAGGLVGTIVLTTTYARSFPGGPGLDQGAAVRSTAGGVWVLGISADNPAAWNPSASRCERALS